MPPPMITTRAWDGMLATVDFSHYISWYYEIFLMLSSVSPAIPLSFPRAVRPACQDRIPRAPPSGQIFMSTEPYLLTPGPLTISLRTKQSMLRDWGSWDVDFNTIT